MTDYNLVTILGCNQNSDQLQPSITTRLQFYPEFKDKIVSCWIKGIEDEIIFGKD